MAIQPILRMGHPILLKPAEPITEFNCAELDTLIQDMFETMADANGAGLAANQIGVSKRVVIFGFDENLRYPDRESVPVTVLINPVITPLSDEMEDDWEGCLSVPGMLGLVPRYERISYRGFDQKGQLIEREADGFHARVVQHECDHLDGVLYPQRMTDLSKLGFVDSLQS